MLTFAISYVVVKFFTMGGSIYAQGPGGRIPNINSGPNIMNFIPILIDVMNIVRMDFNFYMNGQNSCFDILY